MPKPSTRAFEPRSKSNRRSRRALAAACVALFVGLRCVALQADTPLTFAGRQARELFAEPPAKSHEARNFALFGSFRINPADDYQFWRAQSPVWVYPLAGYFRLFGADYPQLRIFSAVYSALGLGLLLMIAAELMRPAVWLLVGLLLALDPLYFHTSRIGILEPAVASWIGLLVLALLRAHNNILWLCLAQVAFVAAFFTKQAAVLALPLLAFGSFYQLTRVGYRRSAFWPVLGCGLVLIGVSGLYIATSDYGRTVTHNIGHVLLGSDAPGQRYHGIGSLFERMRDLERYKDGARSLPISGGIALLTVFGFGLAMLRGRRPRYAELLVLGWFLCALLSMTVVARSALRFWALVVPPAALVTGLGVERTLRALSRSASSAALRQLPLALPLLALLAWSARGHAQFLGNLQYSVRDGARALHEAIGERDATVIGALSPGVVLGTPYKNYYVRGRFNARRSQLLSLHVSHLLLLDGHDSARTVISRRLPHALRGLHPMLALQVRAQRLHLFDVEDRLRAE